MRSVLLTVLLSWAVLADVGFGCGRARPPRPTQEKDTPATVKPADAKDAPVPSKDAAPPAAKDAPAAPVTK